MVIMLLSNMSSGEELVWHHTCDMLKTVKKSSCVRYVASARFHIKHIYFIPERAAVVIE